VTAIVTDIVTVTDAVTRVKGAVTQTAIVTDIAAVAMGTGTN
jgi:hypothetical protein